MGAEYRIQNPGARRNTVLTQKTQKRRRPMGLLLKGWIITVFIIDLGAGREHSPEALLKKTDSLCFPSGSWILDSGSPGS
jgi:hypothetical protein